MGENVPVGYENRSMILKIVPHPVNELKRLCKNEEFFLAIVIAGTYFEHYGKKKLKQHFAPKDVSKIIDDLKLWQIIKYLHQYKLVGKETHKKLEKVREERNKLVHDVIERHELDRVEAEKFIGMAIECIKELYPE